MYWFSNIKNLMTSFINYLDISQAFEISHTEVYNGLAPTTVVTSLTSVASTSSEAVASTSSSEAVASTSSSEAVASTSSKAVASTSSSSSEAVASTSSEAVASSSVASTSEAITSSSVPITSYSSSEAFISPSIGTSVSTSVAFDIFTFLESHPLFQTNPRIIEYCKISKSMIQTREEIKFHWNYLFNRLNQVTQSFDSLINEVNEAKMHISTTVDSYDFFLFVEAINISRVLSLDADVFKCFMNLIMEILQVPYLKQKLEEAETRIKRLGKGLSQNTNLHVDVIPPVSPSPLPGSCFGTPVRQNSSNITGQFTGGSTSFFDMLSSPMNVNVTSRVISSSVADVSRKRHRSEDEEQFDTVSEIDGSEKEVKRQKLSCQRCNTFGNHSCTHCICCSSGCSHPRQGCMKIIKAGNVRCDDCNNMRKRRK
jgi:hypothetical protein